MLSQTKERVNISGTVWQKIEINSSRLTDIQNCTNVQCQWSYNDTVVDGMNLSVGEILRSLTQDIYVRAITIPRSGFLSIVENPVDSSSGNVGIGSIDARSGIIDSFNRVRISAATKVFDAQLQYDAQPIFWDTKIIGNATEVHDPLNSAVDLSVLGEGDKIIRQTKEYYRYQAGDSQAIKMTYTPHLYVDGYFVVRSSTSGSMVDNKVHQKDPSKSTDGISVWNTDALDGEGYSGIEMNQESSQVLFMDLEWLSVGTVAFGVFIDRKLVYAHMAHHANKIRGAYMTTANLPLRYEIEVLNGNLIQRIGYFDGSNGVFYEMVSPGVASGTLKEICTAVESEGGVEEETGVPVSIGTRANPIILGAGGTVYLGIRHTLLYKGLENRAKFIPKEYRVGSTDEQLVVRVVYNPVIVGGTWVQHVENGHESIMEINSTITSISGGMTIDDDDIFAASPSNKSSPDSSRNSITSKLPFGIGIDADTPIAAVLEVTNIGAGLTTVSFGRKWIEVK